LVGSRNGYAEADSNAQRGEIRLWAGLPSGPHARYRRRTLDVPCPARPIARRPTQVSGLGDKSHRHRSQYAVGAIETVGGGGDRRATVLRAASATPRICLDREGTGTWTGSVGPEKMGREVLRPRSLKLARNRSAPNWSTKFCAE